MNQVKLTRWVKPAYVILHYIMLKTDTVDIGSSISQYF